MYKQIQVKDELDNDFKERFNMNIGIDIDDTITDTFDYLMPYIAEYFDVDIEYLKNNNISYSNLPEKWKKDEINFAKKYYDEVILDTPIKPNASSYIKKIKDLGNTIFIITARDKNLYTDPYKTTLEQLRKNKIYPDKLFCTFNKVQVCIDEQIDLFIDDSIEHCQKVSNSGIQTLLFNNKINLNKTVNLNKVNNWKEIYEYILMKGYN